MTPDPIIKLRISWILQSCLEKADIWSKCTFDNSWMYMSTINDDLNSHLVKHLVADFLKLY